MTSIFDLKTSVEELSSTNQGTSKMEYDQLAPTRDVTLTNFPSGPIHFKWQTSGQKWWMPSRSYIRMRCRLSQTNGTTRLALANNIAPNMGLCASLFQSAEFRINEKVISRVADFLPQVDALETRLNKSKAWLDGVGNAVNFWGDDFKVRQTVVASDGVISSGVNETVDVGRLELGFDPTTTVAFTNATSTLTFATGTIPDVRTLFPAGSKIKFTSAFGAAPAGTTFLVQQAPSSTTLILADTIVGGDVVAGVLDFSRVDEGKAGRQILEFELTWTPPLSIFKLGHALPSGNYSLVLNPQTSTVYQKYAIESLLADKTPDTDYAFRVVDMYLYNNTVDGPRADDITYLLDLEQTRCQTDSVTTTSFQQKNFDVSPSTYALSVCYQDLRAGSDTRISASKFKSYNVGITSEEDLKLDRFYLNYAGQNLPSPDADPNFTSTQDYTTQRYVESQMYSGAYYDTGGPESLDEWQKRGPYYYFSIPRDGSDRSTRVSVHQQFTGGDVTNMRVLLFDHSKQVARIKVQDGRVIDCQVEDN